ncbi:hypothetical protein JXJ21_25130 [candidate division KSB1 bacterium]|nr:hypothetical protein [candidate division KSB1 bacterium]
MKCKAGCIGWALIAVSFGCFIKCGSLEKEIMIKRAVIVAEYRLGKSELNAIKLFQSEIENRTGLNFELSSIMPEETVPVIYIAQTKDILKDSSGHFSKLLLRDATEKPEGYQLWIDEESRAATTIHAIGNDDRGVVYALGGLLRAFNYENSGLRIDRNLRVITAPAYPIRGVQLAYRSLPNTYDKWDISQFEQYIKELIVFGANSIEIHPGFPDDPDRNAFMQTETDEMMRQLSALLNDYGLDVWMWYAALDGDYSDPRVVKNALKERQWIFENCERLDHLFVPGGDPGDTHPRLLMPFLEKVAGVLRQVHPGAGLWVSPQGFDQERLHYLYQYMQKEQPDWLTGVVYGPWVHTSLPELRAAIPPKYLIRRYPDITHCVRCQFPVPNWDQAFACTLGREPINPQPIHQLKIHNTLDEYASGSIAYSEGVHDDVNKFIWLALDWDPGENIGTILEQYARYFMPGANSDSVAQGLLNLEENWHGPLLKNGNIAYTSRQWNNLAQAASPGLIDNWRFQLCLFRAFYDDYIRLRLQDEAMIENKFYETYRAKDLSNIAAILQSVPAAFDVRAESNVGEYKTKILKLGEQLFRNIGMQMSVENYGAKGAERGAVLDFLDTPLNNREWIEAEIDRLKTQDETTQRVGFNRILNWEDAGSGGFYDNLGNPEQQPHLLPGVGVEADPGFVKSSHVEFSWQAKGRLSWQCQAQTLYTTPLQMRYENLDPQATYRLRVTYTGRFRAKMTLIADDQFTIHDALAGPVPPQPFEFNIPREATQDGVLELTWHRVEGRGCQVAEVWLVRDER